MDDGSFQFYYNANDVSETETFNSPPDTANEVVISQVTQVSTFSFSFSFLFFLASCLITILVEENEGNTWAPPQLSNPLIVRVYSEFR